MNMSLAKVAQPDWAIARLEPSSSHKLFFPSLKEPEQGRQYRQGDQWKGRTHASSNPASLPERCHRDESADYPCSAFESPAAG